MPTQLEDVSNQVAQSKISNDRLRNEEIRRQMANPWSERQETTTAGTQPTTPINPGGTLASIYSGFKDNATNMGLSGTTSRLSDTSGVSTYDKMPSWASNAVGPLVSGITGNGLYGALSSMALRTASGDYSGAISQGSSLLANKLFSGAGGLVGPLVRTALSPEGFTDSKIKDLGMDVGNSAIGTALSMANPALGTAYGLARMFGLDPIRGANDYSKSDISQRFDSGYQGGWFAGGPGSTRGSWVPTAPDSPTGTYSGSGYGNTAGPGSGVSSSGYSPSGGYFSSGNTNYSPYGGSGYSSSDSGGD